MKKELDAVALNKDLFQLSRCEAIIRPSRLPRLRLARLRLEELTTLAPFLTAIQRDDLAATYRQQDEQILPKAFVALESLFGETTVATILSKAPFGFPC